MEPDGIAETMLEEVVNMVPVACCAAFAGRDLMPRGNHVPEGEILKAFQSVNG